MLNLRPIFHSKQDRIRAHFLLCFISLVIERLLEYRMNGKYSSKQIQKSLSSFSAVQMDGSNIYQIYYYDIVIKDILNNLDINVIRLDSVKKAKCLDVDDNAHLVVMYEDGEIEHISSGEVTIRPC